MMINYYLMQHLNIRSLATLGDRSFTAASPKLWNDLPVVIRHAINVAAFKRLLKPIHLGKCIAASSLFPFYCLEESDSILPNSSFPYFDCKLLYANSCTFNIHLFSSYIFYIEQLFHEGALDMR